MFPEGGVSPAGSYRDARPGLGQIAPLTGATIVPVHIHGTRSLYTPTAWLRARVTVTFGEPLRVAADPQPSRQTSQAISNDVLAAVKRLAPAS